MEIPSQPLGVKLWPFVLHLRTRMEGYFSLYPSKSRSEPMVAVAFRYGFARTLTLAWICTSKLPLFTQKRVQHQFFKQITRGLIHVEIRVNSVPPTPAFKPKVEFSFCTRFRALGNYSFTPSMSYWQLHQILSSLEGKSSISCA